MPGVIYVLRRRVRVDGYKAIIYPLTRHTRSFFRLLPPLAYRPLELPTPLGEVDSASSTHGRDVSQPPWRRLLLHRHRYLQGEEPRARRSLLVPRRQRGGACGRSPRHLLRPGSLAVRLPSRPLSLPPIHSGTNTGPGGAKARGNPPSPPPARQGPSPNYGPRQRPSPARRPTPKSMFPSGTYRGSLHHRWAASSSSSRTGPSWST